MAKAAGQLNHKDGKGWTAGWIGDLPVEEAFDAVQDGRVKLDPGQEPRLSSDVMLVLAGLGVDSLAELSELVRVGRVKMIEMDDQLRAVEGDVVAPYLRCQGCGHASHVPGKCGEQIGTGYMGYVPCRCGLELGYMGGA